MYTQLKEILINYHLNEVCNFNCRYCYSKWEISARAKKEQSIEERILVLQELKSYFQASNTHNPLTQYVRWDKVRINFSGGEPLLIHRLGSLIQAAYDLGFLPSVVTNGILLSEKKQLEITPYLVKLGLSIDSPYAATLHKIGRKTKSGKWLSHLELIETVKLARQLNPSITIKINTLVSNYNKDEDFSPLVDAIEPEEWSVIQVLPFFDQQAKVSTQEFEHFIDKHKLKYPDLVFPETNKDYEASFLMVSPENNFFSNLGKYQNGQYKHSDPIHIVGAHQALTQIDFNFEQFVQRHQDKQALYSTDYTHYESIPNQETIL